MFYNILKISAITAMIFFTGCSNDTDSKDSNSQLTSVSDEVKTLAESLTIHNIVDEQLSTNKEQSHISREAFQVPKENIITTPCKNGGAVKIKNNFDIPDLSNINDDSYIANFNNFSSLINISFDNCLEDGMIMNGSFETNSTSSDQKMIMRTRYLTDFVVTEGEESFKILKDSFITEQMISESKFISTESLKVLYNDETYQSKNLKIAYINDKDSFGFYPISGEEIVNGVSYRVDESYDASKTPMIVTENDGFKKGGKIKYLGKDNSKITIEATSDSELTISVDIDGDGKIDQQDIITP